MSPGRSPAAKAASTQKTPDASSVDPGEFQPDIGPAIGYYCPKAIGEMRKSSPAKGG